MVNTLSSAETGTVSLYFLDMETAVDSDRVPVGYPVEGVEILPAIPGIATGQSKRWKHSPEWRNSLESSPQLTELQSREVGTDAPIGDEALVTGRFGGYIVSGVRHGREHAQDRIRIANINDQQHKKSRELHRSAQYCAEAIRGSHLQEAARIEAFRYACKPILLDSYLPATGGR